MDTFATRPSFEGQSLEFDGYGKDYAITLTDNNNVLSNFHIYDDGGYKIKKSGNSLTVWVEKGNDLTGTITLDRMNRDRIGNTVVWRNPDGKQTLANLRWSDPSSMKVKLRVAVGNIEITKKDELGNTVKGTQFKVSTTADMNNVLGTYTTDDKGKVRVDDIPIKYQTLYYQEVFVPSPYVVDTTVRSIDLEYDKTTLAEVINKHQKGSITIHKEDSETGTTPQGDATLSGWVFGLYADKDKKVKIQDLVGTGNTATSEFLDVNKTYYIYEETVPIGYNPNPEPIKVTINYSNQNVSINKHTAVLKDDVIKGNISIHKIVDKEVLFSLLKSNIKQPLKDVHFKITHDKSGKVVDEMITDKNGYAKSKDLPYGWYTVSEQDVHGYETLEPFKVFIDKQGKVYNYYIENTAIVTQLRIVKKDAETGKVIPLVGTQFKIYDSKGNPVKQHLTYPIPMEIDTYETGKDGKATSKPLYLGKYKVMENSTLDGFLLDKTPYPFELEYKDQNTALVTTSMRLENTRQKAKVSLV